MKPCPRHDRATSGRRAIGDGMAIATCGITVTGNGRGRATPTAHPTGWSTTDAGATRHHVGIAMAMAYRTGTIPHPTAGVTRTGIAMAYPTIATRPRMVHALTTIGTATVTAYRTATTPARTILTGTDYC